MKVSSKILKKTGSLGVSTLGIIFAFLSASPALADDLFFFDNARDGSPLMNRLNGADVSIDIEIYEMNDLTVQKALLDAAAAKVRVRVLIEPTPVAKSCRLFANASSARPGAPTPGDLECETLKSFKRALEKLGGEMRPFNKALCGAGSGNVPGSSETTAKSCLQHGKMVLVRRSAAPKREALLSTGNFNPSSFCNISQKPKACNRDFTIAVRKKDHIESLQTVFELDWLGIPYDMGRKLPPAALNALTISPYSMEPILRFIDSAKKTLQISAQYLKDPSMNHAILQAARSGVKVEILVASFCSFGKPEETEARKIQEIYTAFEEAGVKVRAFPSAIRVNGRPGYMHAKAMVADGVRAWVGSVNGSTPSINRNREFGIFFTDEKPVKKLRANLKSDMMNPNSESWQESVVCKKDRGPLPPEF